MFMVKTAGVSCEPFLYRTKCLYPCRCHSGAEEQGLYATTIDVDVLECYGDTDCAQNAQQFRDELCPIVGDAGFRRRVEPFESRP